MAFFRGFSSLTAAACVVLGALAPASASVVFHLELHELVGRADIGQMIPGEAHYAPGEEVVAFLRRTAEGELRTVGMAQGKFKIVTDASGTRAAQDLRGLALATKPGATPLTIGHAAGQNVPLGE